MIMPRNIVSYIVCMFYFLCTTIIIIDVNKFIYVCYIDIIINAYGIMFINNNINNHITICFSLDLKLC